jgi:hypothetical protein
MSLYDRSTINRAVFQFLMWAMNRDEVIVIGPQIYAAAIMIGLMAMWSIISNLAVQISSGLAPAAFRRLYAICSYVGDLSRDGPV